MPYIEQRKVGQILHLSSKYSRYYIFFEIILYFSRASFDDLYTRSPPSVKLVLVIVEKRDDYTGRQVIECFCFVFFLIVFIPIDHA